MAVLAELPSSVDGMVPQLSSPQSLGCLEGPPSFPLQMLLLQNLWHHALQLVLVHKLGLSSIFQISPCKS